MIGKDKTMDRINHKESVRIRKDWEELSGTSYQVLLHGMSRLSGCFVVSCSFDCVAVS